MSSSMASEILGLAATVLSVGMLSAPAKHFRGIVKAGSVGKWSVNPYIIGFIQCLLWCIYDIETRLLMHGITNALGMVLQGTFVVIFVWYAPGQRLEIVAKTAAATGLSLGLSFLLLSSAADWELVGGEPAERPTRLLGYVCMVVAVVMFGAPLDVTAKVIARRVAVEDCLPWLLSLLTVLTLFAWLGYGLLHNDLNVWGPCLPGIGLGLMQLALYALYRGCPPLQDASAAAEGATANAAVADIAEKQQQVSGLIDIEKGLAAPSEDSTKEENDHSGAEAADISNVISEMQSAMNATKL